MKGKLEAQRQGTYTLLDIYQQVIAPKLKEIDVFLKTTDGRITIRRTAKILDISEEEIRRIMAGQNIKKMDKKAFIRIMENGSSPICGFFRRELDRGSPFVYTRQDIAYIYNLDLELVNRVCDFLHIKEITPYTMPQVFSLIYIA